MNKVLIVLNSLQTTGAYLSIMQNCNDLKEQFEFHFAIPSNSKLEHDIRAMGFATTTYHPLYLSKSLKSISYFSRLKKDAIQLCVYMDQHNIKLIHVNDIYNQVGQRIKKLSGDKLLIQHVRLRKNSYIRALYPFFAKRAMKYADQLVAVSQIVKNDLQGNDVMHIYNPLQNEIRHPEYLVEDSDPIHIAYFGRLMPGKGQMLMLEAFRMAFKNNEKLRIKFIGVTPDESEYVEKLKAYCRENKLSEAVTFHAFTEDVEYEMKQADMVVNFSESESFSRVCLEALYFGVPLISSDCGGPAELFEDKVSGILVENRNVKKLSEEVLNLASDVTLRKQFSIEGKKYVREKFSKENTSEKLALLYKKLSNT